MLWFFVSHTKFHLTETFGYFGDWNQYQRYCLKIQIWIKMALDSKFTWSNWKLCNENLRCWNWDNNCWWWCTARSDFKILSDNWFCVADQWGFVSDSQVVCTVNSVQRRIQLIELAFGWYRTAGEDEYGSLTVKWKLWSGLYLRLSWCSWSSWGGWLIYIADNNWFRETNQFCAVGDASVWCDISSVMPSSWLVVWFFCIRLSIECWAFLQANTYVTGRFSGAGAGWTGSGSCAGSGSGAGCGWAGAPSKLLITTGCEKPTNSARWVTPAFVAS